MNEAYLVQECKRYNKLAQKELYEKYSGLLRGICRRYIPSEESEDVFQDGFIKILSKIKKFKYLGPGSLEAWMKRIMINTSITFYRKSKKHKQIMEFDTVNKTSIETDEDEELTREEVLQDKEKNVYQLVNYADFSKEELLDALNQIPENFRLVFNLHSIEGLRHKEIGDMLGIDEKTSRTRLLRGRKKIQQILYDKSLEKLQNK